MPSKWCSEELRWKAKKGAIGCSKHARAAQCAANGFSAILHLGGKRCKKCPPKESLVGAALSPPPPFFPVKRVNVKHWLKAFFFSRSTMHWPTKFGICSGKKTCCCLSYFGRLNSWENSAQDRGHPNKYTCLFEILVPRSRLGTRYVLKTNFNLSFLKHLKRFSAVSHFGPMAHSLWVRAKMIIPGSNALEDQTAKQIIFLLNNLFIFTFRW